MPIRLAFLGFRHSHMLGLYRMAQRHPQIQIMAACEENTRVANELAQAGEVQLTHQNSAEMLASVPCDAIAIGDYYSRRGSLIIQSLQAGKHVLCDKPLCTDLGELERIKQLVASYNLAIGCLLDLRGSGAFRAARRLILDNAIGEVHTVSFSAQHPLMLDARPAWFFEPDQHGGVINDIGIHGIDLIPWLTGRNLAEALAVRTWSTRLPRHPRFQNAGQFMLRLDNGGGVLADVSYLAPDRCGYVTPQYWRVTCHGDRGMIETAFGNSRVMLARSCDEAVQELPADASEPEVCLNDFIADITGRSADGALTRAGVLAASHQALLMQQAAERGEWNIRLN